MSYCLAPGDDPTSLIDHFNAFHDGFVREIRVRSRDAFTIESDEAWDIGHQQTGRFDVVVAFAHYNYPPGALQSHERVAAGALVEGRFSDVRDVYIDSRNAGPTDGAIQSVAIEPTEREGFHGAPAEPCFALSVTSSRLDGGTWISHTSIAFTFSEVEFEER